MAPTNTALERLAIDGAINLSDGHARQPLTDAERGLIARLPIHYEEARGLPQSAAEDEFAARYFQLAGEPHPRHIAFSYSTSCLVALVAQMLADEGRPVVLPEPSFDNIRDLLIRSGVEVIPVPEETVLELSPSDLEGRALWLTLPNNPSGWTTDERGFSDIAYRVKTAGSSLLIIDFCFRLFSDALAGWSQYEVLTSAGVDFLTLEDTGKTFPLLDMKVGLLVGAATRMGELTRRNQEVLLNVSPWLLLLLRDFCALYHEQGLERSVWHPNLARRDVALAALHDASRSIRVVGSGTAAPFLWLELTPVAKEFTATEVVAAARTRDLHLLPGTQFFSEPDRGERFLRIPTARSELLLRRGSEVLASLLDELSRR